jgi:3-isopropylmalate/(R)-2-methylmalate dehydratase small subunit
VTLEVNAHRVVIEAAGSGEPLEISLARQSIRLCDGQTFAFAVDPGRRRDLMLGRDEIGAILADDADDIAAFERGRKTSSPWLKLNEDQLARLDGLGEADL